MAGYRGIDPGAFTNAFNTQRQLGANLRAADQAHEFNEQENAFRIADRAQATQDREAERSQTAFPKVGAIAAQIASLGDPQQKRLAFKQAITANAPLFDTMGMPHTEALAKLDTLDDAGLDATLAKLATFAPRAAPTEVTAGNSLVQGDGRGGFTTAYTAPTKPGETKSPFGSIDPANYTRESIAKFQQTNNYGDLVALAKTPDAGQVFSQANALRDEYTKAEAPFVDMLASFETLKTLGSNASPAGDIAMVASFMRAVDPGSRVTGAEQATAENAGGVPAVIRGYYNKLVGEGQLSEAQRQDFMTQAENLVSGRTRGYRETRTKYEGLAKRAGVNPLDVIGDERKISGSVKKLPDVDAKGWHLRIDPQGNRAYVSPDGTQFREVQ